jgi:uroporphyrinogen decarboxylase
MTQTPAPASTAWHDSPFLKACRREAVPYTPVWLMRQAGRYMKEYRELREKTPFLRLCKTPQLVSEITVFAAERIGADAAILFSDLLLPAQPMGLKLEYTKEEGPTLTPAVRTAEAIDALKEVDPDSLNYVYEAVRLTRREMPADLPLIGFGGAPFTLASYLIEGGHSRNYEHTKTLMYGDPGAWNALLAKLVRCQTQFLNRQLRAGASAVQIFDSWVGTLSPADYRQFVQPHSRALIEGLDGGHPVIHFGTGNAGLLAEMRAAGGTVIGLDWRVDLGQAWTQLGPDVGVMGNLDPCVLLADEAHLEKEVKRVLAEAGNRPGHVFNLGHGVLPQTQVDRVRRLVDLVHESSRR